MGGQRAQERVSMRESAGNSMGEGRTRSFQLEEICILYKEPWEHPAKMPARERGCKGASAICMGKSSPRPIPGAQPRRNPRQEKRRTYERETAPTNPSTILSWKQVGLKEEIPFEWKEV